MLADAIIFNADGVQVAVVENGVVHLRKVSVLRDLGSEVEINSGVKAGDQVLTPPSIWPAAARCGSAPRRRRRPESRWPRQADFKTLFNGGTGPSDLCFLARRSHRAYSLAGGVYVTVERTAPAAPCSLPQGGAALSGSLAGARFRCMIQRLQGTDSMAPVAASERDVDLAAGERQMARILLIEDDGETAEEIRAELSDRGFDVLWAADGIDGLDKARSSQPDAMIVDRLLPGMDGLTVIETLRKEQVRTPVLVLSALGAVDDRVRGLRMGGDDYLTKPFAIVELVARMEALLRRPAELRETTLKVGPLELDLIERTGKRGDRPIELLPREFRLLEYMMRRADQLLTRAMLLEEVWHYKFVPATNLVDVHMGRLRHKVDGPNEAPMIHNVRGAGFILRAVP